MSFNIWQRYQVMKDHSKSQKCISNVLEFGLLHWLDVATPCDLSQGFMQKNEILDHFVQFGLVEEVKKFKSQEIKNKEVQKSRSDWQVTDKWLTNVEPGPSRTSTVLNVSWG